MTPSSTPEPKADWTERTTLSVVETGRILGLGRSAAYDAVRRGDIPTLKIGRRYLVPVQRLMALLSGDQS